MIPNLNILDTEMRRISPKLLLFDIDGTLLSTHGIPRQAMSTVLKRRFSEFNYDTGFNFSGRTDWEIVEHLLRFDDRPCDDELVHRILDDFGAELEIVLQNGRHPLIYPGVRPLLDKLYESERFYLGLVTGNIAKGARIKLTKAGLDHFFAIGGFGDDSNNRNDLPPLAITRAEKQFGCSFERKNIWVIGDSPRDIGCARHNDLKALAVSTGWTSYEDLHASDPDHLVRDFTAVDEIIGVLSG
jgi:phosphoglycolate phosphatase